MALTGTFKKKLTDADGWQLISSGDAFCGGKVTEGQCELWFEITANAPTKDSEGVPYRTGETWNYTVGALNSVWARAATNSTLRFHCRAS